MSTTSPLLQLILQVLDENPDTWGDVLNVSAMQLLEDAIAGTAVADVTSGNVTLDDTVGGPSETDSSRYAIVNVIGTPGGTNDVIVPTRSKIYLVSNTTTASSVQVKTAAGTGITIANGVAIWVFCDGTDVQAASVDAAQTSLTTTLADDSTLFGGAADTDFAKLAVAQTWSKGQVISRAPALTNAGGIITPDISESDSFYALWDGNYQLAAPAGSPQNGQRFSIICQQDNPAGPNTISFAASTYIFEGGTTPALSTGNSDIDYIAFEYCTNLVGGARWIGSILKGAA